MQVTVEIPDGRIAELVRQRINELLSDDARYRETGVRALVREIVDKAAGEAVRQANDAISAELPTMAAEAVRRATHEEIERAAKRGLGALRKLYAGFDPARLTQEQLAWVKRQIEEAGKKAVDG